MISNVLRGARSCQRTHGAVDGPEVRLNSRGRIILCPQMWPARSRSRVFTARAVIRDGDLHRAGSTARPRLALAFDRLPPGGSVSSDQLLAERSTAREQHHRGEKQGAHGRRIAAAASRELSASCSLEPGRSLIQADECRRCVQCPHADTSAASRPAIMGRLDSVSSARGEKQAANTPDGHADNHALRGLCSGRHDRRCQSQG